MGKKKKIFSTRKTVLFEKARYSRYSLKLFVPATSWRQQAINTITKDKFIEDDDMLMKIYDNDGEPVNIIIDQLQIYIPQVIMEKYRDIQLSE